MLFVNGQVMPTITIRSGEVQRWRVINVSAARIYRLAIPGQTLLHVGDDGGLFERPVEINEFLLANSERVELLVRGTGAPGSRALLQDLPYDRYDPHTRPADWETTRDLLTLQYDDTPPVAPVQLPATLRHIVALDTTKVTARHVIVLSQGLINGRTMDMNRVDVRSRLGATEIWEIQNVVTMDHPFHLHGFQFQILDRDGVPEPYRSWKDVINVPQAPDGPFHRPPGRLSRPLDVSLPHTRPRRPWNDGHSRRLYHHHHGGECESTVKSQVRSSRLDPADRRSRGAGGVPAPRFSRTRPAARCVRRCCSGAPS